MNPQLKVDGARKIETGAPLSDLTAARPVSYRSKTIWRVAQDHQTGATADARTREPAGSDAQGPYVPSSFAQSFDDVAIEEPLEIRLNYSWKGRRESRTVSITMRTPGNDAELAAGLLFAEGIVRRPEEIAAIHVRSGEGDGQGVQVELQENVDPKIEALKRNFLTSSACGVCGRTMLRSLEDDGCEALGDELRIKAEVLALLPNQLRAVQAGFSQTGGLHAAAIFSVFSGELLAAREDVGRHNALDKLIGMEFLAGRTPLAEHVLLLSGRASFELLQKALMAGVPIVAAVGAPSSLAVEVAQKFQITLVGFLREGRFNIYSGARRIV